MAYPTHSCPPDREVSSFGKAFPGIWSRVDKVRSKGRGHWPKWCYLPYEEARQIMSKYDPKLPPDLKTDDLRSIYQETEAARSILAHNLCLYSAWRHTKGVYRFDPDIFEMVIDTEIDRDLPCEILTRLPEWGVAIETPNLKIMQYEKSHVLVTVTMKENAPVILLNCDLFSPIVIPLARQSIAEALERDNIPGVLDDIFEPFVRRALCLAIYLCCDAPDLSGGTERRNLKPTKTNHGLRYFPPEKVQMWNVGCRMGAKLRTAAKEWAEAAKGADSESDAEGARRARPRPHARKAHFRRVWHGSGDSANAVWTWFPTTLVNARSPNAIIKTIRKVEE